MSIYEKYSKLIHEGKEENNEGTLKGEKVKENNEEIKENTDEETKENNEETKKNSDDEETKEIVMEYKNKYLFFK